MRLGNKWWKDHADEVRDLYINQHLSINDLSNHYNCYPKTITEQLKKLNIPARNTAQDRYNGKYSIDVQYFDVIDTEDKAYILGFILADGHVSRNDTLMFGLQAQDVDILYQIQSAMKSTHPVRIKKYATLMICSRTICKRLLEMGFTHTKSHEFNFFKILDCVPIELRIHMIRGMFDGDGSARIYKYPYLKKSQYHFGYTGLYDVCRFVHDFFALNTKIVDEGNGIFTCVSSYRSQIIDILSKMYDGASIYMNRKREIFFEMQRIFQIEQ